MEKYFNLKRFYKTFKFDLILYRKIYISILIGISLALFFIDFIAIQNTYKAFNENQYRQLFLVIFGIANILVIGTSFPFSKNKKETSNYLLLPASIFEKVLIQFLLRIVLFNAIFFPLFLLIFKFSTSVYYLFDWKSPVLVANNFKLFTAFNEIPNTLDVWAVGLGILSLASFIFLGASYFKKYAFFKTLLWFSVLVGLVIFSMMLFTNIFYPEHSKDFNDIHLRGYKVSEDLYSTQRIIYIIAMVSSFFLLPAAYFKLKEKQA